MNLRFSVLKLNLQCKTDLHKSKTRLVAHKIDGFRKYYLDLCCWTKIKFKEKQIWNYLTHGNQNYLGKNYGANEEAQCKPLRAKKLRETQNIWGYKNVTNYA